MNAFDIVAALGVALLAVYLFWALLFPEDLS